MCRAPRLANFKLLPLAFCLASLSACSPDSPGIATYPAAIGAGARAQDSSNFAARMLEVHNRYRAAAGAPLLQWDPSLAAQALAYGPQLGARGDLVHSPRELRRGQGENLWMGTAGAYSPEAMVESWASERSMFRPGIFPNVSTTGNWVEVAHYTQMIWRGTTHLGCGLHRSGRWDYLICRYSPAGNVDGQRVP